MMCLVRLLLLTVAALQAEEPPAVPPTRSLAEAADACAAQIPKGAIVTAEAGPESVHYAVAGKPEPKDVPKEDLLFEIGSITKVFNGLLLAQAVVEGKVTLDTPLKRALGLKDAFDDPRVENITLQQLATHTSGLPRLPGDLAVGGNPHDPYAHFDHDRLCAALKAVTLPGNGPFPVEYSNFGAGLLGAVLACLYDTTWEQLVAEKITRPLGLRDTTVTLSTEQRKRFAPPYDGSKRTRPWQLNALAGAGALRSTASDMVTFGRALAEPEKTPLHQAIKLLLRPCNKNDGIGLGIFISKVDGQTVYEHTGGTGGYRSLLRVQPDSKRIHVVLINNARLEAMAVMNATRLEKPRSSDSAKVLSPAELAGYTGVYGRFTVLSHDGHLMARLSGQTFLPLHPHEKTDRFFYKAVAAEIQFDRKDGEVHSLTLHQNGREMIYEKTDARTPAIIFRQGSELAEYTGVYQLPLSAAFKVSVHGDTLFAKLGSQPSLPVFETGKDCFDYEAVKARLVFERNKEGKIEALHLHQNGMIQRAVKKP